MQGCLLSPFLFSVVMTCLISDVNSCIENEFGMIAAKVVMTRSILYADDTLILEVNVRIA